MAYSTSAVLVLFQICFGIVRVYSLDTYYLSENCGRTIDMTEDGINTGRLELDTSFIGDCNVTIEAWPTTTDKLMFYWEEMSIPESEEPIPETGRKNNAILVSSESTEIGGSVFCETSFVEVYYGLPPDLRPFEGIPRLCGSSAPRGDFVSKGRFVTFRYFNQNNATYARMKLIFTAFHRGHCYGYEYRCDNGRCIDNSINCNGYNPCGDDSDCHLSDAAVVGIVVSALFGIAVIATIVAVVFKKRRTRVDESTNAAHTTSPFDVSPAALLHSVPPPSYGASQPHQYTQARVYGVTASIQDDQKHE